MFPGNDLNVNFVYQNAGLPIWSSLSPSIASDSCCIPPSNMRISADITKRTECGNINDGWGNGNYGSGNNNHHDNNYHHDEKNHHDNNSNEKNDSSDDNVNYIEDDSFDYNYSFNDEDH